MNFRINCKNSRDWNPVILAIYEWTPNSKIWNPLRWILWKIEQLRTPKGFYDDRTDECWF